MSGDVLASGVTLEALDLPSSIEVVWRGATCGVRVRGLDLSRRLRGAEVFALKRLADHAGLLVVEGQERLTPERQGEVIEWFGGGYLPPGLIEGVREKRTEMVNVMSPAGGPTRHLSVHPHTDNQPAQVTPDFTILCLRDGPPASAGGNTYYGNLYQAYDELDAATRERILDLEQRPLLQDWANYACFDAIREDMDDMGMRPDPRAVSPVRHPVVRTHPVTGRRALWISLMTDRVLGLPEEEAISLTERLKRHVQQEHLYTRHEWKRYDLAIWDNRCVLHKREAWDPAYTRRLWGSQAGCARPF